MTLRASRLVFALAAALALGTVGCASDEEKVASHIEAAEEYKEAEDYRSALVELRAALSIEPKSADLNLRIADVYQIMGRPQAAFFYGEAYRLDKTLTRAALLQVPVLYASDADAALALVEEVLEREPANIDAHTRRAEVLLVKADTDAALSAALTATELDPAHINARRMVTAVHRARIREALLRGQTPPEEVFESAIAAAEAAARASKGEDQLGEWFDHMDEALIYSEWEGHVEDAEREIREAYRLAEAREDERGILAVTREARRIAMGHPDMEFRKWALERWVAAEPGAVTGWRRLAALERETGGSSDEVWDRGLSARPDDVALHGEYVRMLLATRQEERAFAYLENLPPELADSADMGALAFELHLSNDDLASAKLRLDELQVKHPDDPLTQLSAAAYALRMADTRGAVEKLRTLAAQVERADVLRQLAIAESRSGNQEAALAAIERSLELQPARAAHPHQLRIRLLASKGDWLAVLQSWRDMRRQGFASDPTSETLRIQALYELERSEAARPLLEAALKAEPVRTRDILLFNQYESGRQPERALEMTRVAWEKAPESIALTRLLMRHALGRKDTEEALRILEENRKLTGHSAAPAMHARTLIVAGRPEEAEALAIETFERKPRPFGASPLLNEILAARGKSDLTIQMLDESFRDGSLQPAGLWQLGRIYYQLEEYEKALPPLERAVELNPQFSPAVSDLALVLAELGRDLDRAVTLARQVKSQNPENPGIADTLGYVYLKKGLAEPAAFEFRSAIELEKVRGREVAEYHYHLGLALKAQGRDVEAGLAFDDALRIEPEHDAARQARAG